MDYKKQARKDSEVSIVVALQSLQNDQVGIAGLEVEMSDLKNATNHVMDMVLPYVAVEEPKPLIDRLIVAPEKLTDLLRVSSLTNVVEALVRVKCHFHEVNMAKVRMAPIRRKTSRP
jgi:hypothetical protein